MREKHHGASCFTIKLQALFKIDSCLIGFLIIGGDRPLRFVDTGLAFMSQSFSFKHVGTNAATVVEKNNDIGNNERDPDRIYDIDAR